MSDHWKAEQQAAAVERMYRDLREADDFARRTGSLEGERPMVTVEKTAPKACWLKRYCFGLLVPWR